MKLALVIPAKCQNKYHKNGDLAPFGDTTLLEWKISQCLEAVDIDNLYISTDSDSVNDELDDKFNIIKRAKDLSFSEAIIETVKNIDAEYIMWVNPTSPFINGNDYKSMIEKYSQINNEYDSLITSIDKKDFIYFKGDKLNFENYSDGRSIVESISMATNGVYINKKENILKDKELVGENPYFYNLPFMESLEIKDEYTYTFLKELIFIYFKKELDV